MNSDPRDYILDLSTAPGASAAREEDPDSKIQNQKNPYLSIYFRCCNIYAPIYRNRAATAYSGHCPRCQRPATVPISPSGSNARIFQAE